MAVNNINGNLYQNPECLPLEDLEFKMNINGVSRNIKAFSDFWVETRFHCRYPGPPKAHEEEWLNSMIWFNKELEWMLNLEHFRFWSNIIFDAGCMESLVSFLQEASPFYFPFQHESEKVSEAYFTAYQRVLQIFCRIITNKENESSWMGKPFLADLLYNYSLITIPILWDLTALYGIDNVTILTRFMDTVFKLQPKYKDDLRTAYLFLREKVFTTIENQSGAFTETSTNSLGEQINLYPTSAESALADLAWHVLDCAATMRHFLEVYPSSKLICRDLKMCSSLAQLYDTCIPVLFNKLFDKNNSNIVDKARVELLECYRLILNTCTEEALAKLENASSSADIFLEIISDTLHVLHNQKTFIQDLLEKQPLHNDLELLRQICHDLDSVKCDFILQSLMSSVDDVHMKKMISQNVFNSDQSTSKYSNNISDDEGACGGTVLNEKDISNAIGEVAQVFPDLGTGYIKRLLDYFGNSVNVISALLEDNIPPEFNSFDKSEPYIPPDPLEELHAKLGNTHLNVFDGDKLDMRVCDVPKELWQSKHKRGPKNVNELLNDKSDIKAMKTKYEEYNFVYDNVYDDEYDDSYEVPPSKQNMDDEDSDSSSRRPTELPRVLRKTTNNDSQSESDDQEEDESSSAGPVTKFKPFCENPEEVRARRDAQRKHKLPNRDVVGKPKGQGQDKDVTQNRDKKNTNKSTRANHNRRQGAQWKRSRGMMPF